MPAHPAGSCCRQPPIGVVCRPFYFGQLIRIRLEMSLSDPVYDLKELCQRADVTVRTVRYYIQQGLLEAPGTPGPGPKYGEGHLLRLKLIRRLQSEHLPLAEIRKSMGALDDKAVRKVLQTKTPRPGGSASDYIQGVLSGKTSTSSIALKARGKGQSRRKKEPTSGSYRVHSQWERIALSEDIELHVRRPLSRLQRRKLDKLLTSAQEILENGAG